MSGGHFQYTQYQIFQVADEVEAYIKKCKTSIEDEWGYKPEYSPETMEKFQQCEDVLRLAAAMLHRMDWLICGDDGEETFHERWKEDIG